MSKIDCNVTENYLKEKARMIKIEEDGLCAISCVDCPLCSDNNGTNENGAEFERLYPAKAIELVQKWSDEHPQPTMLDKFKEQHPKAQMNEDGTPIFVCPFHLGYEEQKDKPCRNMKYACIDCWNRAYEGE